MKLAQTFLGGMMEYKLWPISKYVPCMGKMPSIRCSRPFQPKQFAPKIAACTCIVTSTSYMIEEDTPFSLYIFIEKKSKLALIVFHLIISVTATRCRKSQYKFSCECNCACIFFLAMLQVICLFIWGFLLSIPTCKP